MSKQRPNLKAVPAKDKKPNEFKYGSKLYKVDHSKDLFESDGHVLCMCVSITDGLQLALTLTELYRLGVKIKVG